jgi:seryl-tRNA synthetase
MKDIFTKLKNFLSEPSSTMALIGTIMVFVSSFFVTPTTGSLVLVSSLAVMGVIAMRIVEVHLTKRILERDEVIREKDDELRTLRQDIDGISAACKKKHEDYNELQAKYDERIKDIQTLEAALEEARKPKENEVITGPNVTMEAARPPKKSDKKYSKKDVQRIREEIKSASKERDEFGS